MQGKEEAMRDTIELCKEAGYPLMVFEGVTYVSPELERLVALVRADERNELYKIVMDAPFRQNVETEENGEDLLFVLKVMAFDITSAIRARGNT
jgi:hypothetical protein